jgi:hypothetical protein
MPGLVTTSAPARTWMVNSHPRSPFERPGTEMLVVKSSLVPTTVWGSRYCKPTMFQEGSTSTGVTCTGNTNGTVGTSTVTEYREPAGEGRGLGEELLDSLGPLEDVGVKEGLDVREGLSVGEVVSEAVVLGVGLGVWVEDGVVVELSEPETEPLAVTVWEVVGLLEGVEDSLVVVLGEEVGDVDGDEVCVGVDVVLSLGAEVEVADVVALDVPEPVPEADVVGVEVSDGLSVADPEGVMVLVDVGVSLGVNDGVVVTLGLEGVD